jgi:hypothetical protein
MASTKAQEKASKKYYHSNQKYREKKIAETQRKQKANRPKYNKDKREYYEENEEYRKYKRRYAKEYRKREPIKSKARKDRKAHK